MRASNVVELAGFSQVGDDTQTVGTTRTNIRAEARACRE
jgi:hypothetical protein